MEIHHPPRTGSSSPSSPEAKRQKLCPSKKVCIICSQITGMGYIYNVYVVDADAAGANAELMRKEFILRIMANREFAFQVLNSTLYMFEGSSPWNRDFSSNKSAYKLDLTVCEAEPKELTDVDTDEGYVQKLNEMVLSKRYPIAVATPDGKRILVLSSEARQLDPEHRFGYVHDFELFDIGDGSWKALPSLPTNRLVEEYQVILSYGFVNDSVFLVSIKNGVFYLNVDVESACWLPDGPNKFNAPAIPIPIPSGWGPFVVPSFINYLVSCDDLSVEDEDEDMNYYSRLKNPSFSSAAGHDWEGEPCYLSIISHDDKGKCSFCIVAVGEERSYNGSHYLAMDVYTSDIKKKHKAVTLIKSLEYELDAHIGSPPLDIVSVAPYRPIC